MDLELVNLLVSLVVIIVTTPAACFGLWRTFGESFMSGLAPVEFSSSKGQIAVVITCLSLITEYCCCLVVVAVPSYYAEVDGVASMSDLLKTFPDSLSIGWELLLNMNISAVWCLLKWSTYSITSLLFAISYIKCIDTRSDALFTIDRQKGETICNMCSRLIRLHTQHCPYCWRCTDRFDHHSFWINNCVAERNSKYYTLAMVYNEIRCVLAFCLMSPLLYDKGFQIIPFVVCLSCSISFFSIGFNLVVWVIAVTYGFNNICVPRCPTQTSSLEILDSVLSIKPSSFSLSAYKNCLDLPPTSPAKMKENWRLLLGHKGWKWYPSLPSSFPDYGNHAFIFKKSL